MGVSQDSRLFSGAAPQSHASKPNERQPRERLRLEAGAIAVVADCRTVIGPAKRAYRVFYHLLRFFGVVDGRAVVDCGSPPPK